MSAQQQEDQPHISWDSRIDLLLAEWCDNAKCFEWMHAESHSIYDRFSKRFMIATNCLTAVAGLGNVISGGTHVNGFELAWLFGSISIFVSTMNILQDKLGYQQQSIIHKGLASDWSIIITKIQEILTIPYSARKDCKAFLKYLKADMNKASLEGNHMIPKIVREECYNKFKGIDGFNIPDICGEMEHTKVSQWTTEESKQPLV